jgi:hypothetical protein
MKNDINKVIVVTTGAILFNIIFWQEKQGVNTVLFDVFILAALFYLYPSARQAATVRWLLPGHLLCLAMVVIHNTVLSKIAFGSTLLLLAGFGEYIHRSAWFASGSVLMNMLLLPASFVEPIKLSRNGRKGKNISKIIRFAVIPLLLVGIFFIIYLAANSVLQDIAEQIGAKLELFIDYFFDFFYWERLLFLLLGLFITGLILLKSRVDYFSGKDAACKDELQRSKTSMQQRRKNLFFNIVQAIMGRFASGMLALKNENTTGFISLILLNGLLIAINIIDISYLWFDFDYQRKVFLYKMVHEGTELLIVSIVLAMMILLFFFKGNLNFYRRNKWLKYGAYLWIVQNIILIISVFMRDYYYILRYGLAYKRIGVLFFLLMVLIGLVTVFIKIFLKKTNYFLFRVNAWAGIAVLIVSTTIHWDEFIAGYNLKRMNTITPDIPFLLRLSDKALPLLDSNMAALQKKQQEAGSQATSYNKNHYIDIISLKLQQREARFVHEQQQLSWLSWNYADAYTKDYLKRKGLYPVNNKK